MFQKISADALTEDPDTGVPVQRVISGGAGLQFKGTGFYQTDYVKPGKDSDEKPKVEKSSEPKSDKADAPAKAQSKSSDASSSSGSAASESKSGGSTGEGSSSSGRTDKSS